MLFRRKTLPDGSARIDPDHAQIDMLDKWHQQESAWAAGLHPAIGAAPCRANRALPEVPLPKQGG